MLQEQWHQAFEECSSFVDVIHYCAYVVVVDPLLVLFVANCFAANLSNFKDSDIIALSQTKYTTHYVYSLILYLKVISQHITCNFNYLQHLQGLKILFKLK